MYLFFETIRISNGIAQNVDYHQRRMDNTIRLKLGSSNLPELTEIISVPESFTQGIVKCKIEYTSQDYHMSFDHYNPRTIKSLKLVYCNSINYAHKYCDRQLLNDLFEKRANCDDILIVKNGRISDTSFSNIALFDGYTWYTPDSPLLPGTARARMIDSGVLKEMKISDHDLHDFQSFELINSMLDNNFSNKNPVSTILK